VALSKTWLQRALTPRSTGPLAGGAGAPSARGRLAWFVRRHAPTIQRCRSSVGYWPTRPNLLGLHLAGTPRLVCLAQGMCQIVRSRVYKNISRSATAVSRIPNLLHAGPLHLAMDRSASRVGAIFGIGTCAVLGGTNCRNHRCNVLLLWDIVHCLS